MSEPTAPGRRSYDVVVVGARAAGAATAMLLARAGFSVLAVDRSRAGADTLSTHALLRGGVLQLQRWGLIDRIITAGTPPITRSTFRTAGQTVTIEVKPANGVSALYAPRRTVVDPLLVAAAREAGATVLHEVAARELVWDGGRVRGVVLGIGGRAATVTADLVIGADGLDSMVAAAVAAPVTHTGRHGSDVTYGYWSELPVDGYEWVFRAGASSGIIPTNDGAACVFVSGTPAAAGRGGVTAIEQALADGAPDLADRLAASTRPTATRTWRSRPGYLRRPWGPGWALVGDAGFHRDPLGAHGITDAFRDAELLAGAVIAARRHGDLDHGHLHHGHLDHHLAGYEATRDELSVEVLRLTDRIASHRWTEAEILELLPALSRALDPELALLAALPEPPVPAR